MTLLPLLQEHSKFDLTEVMPEEGGADEGGAERVMFGVYAPRLWAWMREKVTPTLTRPQPSPGTPAQTPAHLGLDSREGNPRTLTYTTPRHYCYFDDD